MEQNIKAVLITKQDDPEVVGLINDLASLLGLKRATALKMHLRDTLPAKIAKLRRRRQEGTVDAMQNIYPPAVVSEG